MNKLDIEGSELKIIILKSLYSTETFYIQTSEKIQDFFPCYQFGMKIWEMKKLNYVRVTWSLPQRQEKRAPKKDTNRLKLCKPSLSISITSKGVYKLQIPFQLIILNKAVTRPQLNQSGSFRLRWAVKYETDTTTHFFSIYWKRRSNQVTKLVKRNWKRCWAPCKYLKNVVPVSSAKKQYKEDWKVSEVTPCRTKYRASFA